MVLPKWIFRSVVTASNKSLSIRCIEPNTLNSTREKLMASNKQTFGFASDTPYIQYSDKY